MPRKKRHSGPPPPKKNRSFGMEELKLGMKPVKKHWHFDKRKASNPQITKTKRFSDGRVFIDYPDGRKIIRMPDGTERERTL